MFSLHRIIPLINATDIKQNLETILGSFFHSAKDTSKMGLIPHPPNRGYGSNLSRGIEK
jgi:hypothetical protein